jgi:hypothetical protein
LNIARYIKLSKKETTIATAIILMNVSSAMIKLKQIPSISDNLDKPVAVQYL